MALSEADFGRLMGEVDVHDLERLRRAKDAIAELGKRKAVLLAEVAKIDDEVDKLRRGELEPPPLSVVRRRPVRLSPSLRRQVREVREGSLGDHIRRFLKARSGKPASVREIVEGVVAAGYRSSAKNLGLRVRTTLSGCDFAERAERGMYRLKEG